MDRAREPVTCAEIGDDLAALAVGALTGRERAAVLAHVESCRSCAAELESLSSGADALLGLYPEFDPGVAFTERVVARIGLEQQHPARRRHPVSLRVAVAATIVALALAAGLVGALVGSSDGNQRTSATATLHSPSGSAGKVVLTSGHGNWLVMTLDDGAATGTVTCRVTLRDGSTRTVGHFALHDGYGSWSVRLPVSSSAVMAVTVTRSDGDVVASAAV